MRPLDDAGWKTRLRALREIVLDAKRSHPALEKALSSESSEERALAAQALSWMGRGGADLRAALERLAREDGSAVVRLYAIDALGALGGKSSDGLFSELAKSDENRDVRSHAKFALERKGEPAEEPAYRRALLDFDPASSGTAMVGKPAPAFRLEDHDGSLVELGSYRGTSAVVLVFVYGDT